jgi:hypothetical protein
MRTKTLLSVAAMLAVSFATTTRAQVYSANVVGYINQSIPTGFSMVANQLDTGTNTVGNLLPAPPNNTSIFKFAGAGYIANNYYYGWTDPTMTLNPGEGFFVYNPGAPITNAFVGTVLQGTFTNAITTGFTFQSYVVPKTGLITTDLHYPAVNNDTVYAWDTTNQNFVTYNFFYTWGPSEPMLNVGESVFIYHPGAPTNWVTTFTAQ